MKRLCLIIILAAVVLLSATSALRHHGAAYASNDSGFTVADSGDPAETATTPPRDSGDDDADSSSRKENGQDFVRIFGSGSIDEGEQVNDVVLIFSDGTIRGDVMGSCVVIGGKARIADSATVKGDLVSIFSSLSISRHARLKGDRVNIGSYESTGIPDFVKTLFSSWDLMLAMLLLLIFWKFVLRMTDRFLMNPAASIVTGFFGLIGFIPLIVLLAISIVGILLIPVVPLLYYFSFVLGFAVTGMVIGNEISHRSGKEMTQPLKAILVLLAVLIVIKLCALFPLIGPLTAEVIKMVIRTAGLGLLFIVIWDAVKKRKAA